MFERELNDATFLQRWGIVRVLRPQSVADHTFLVAHYANDIAVYLGLSNSTHLRLLQRVLWHDVRDEVFTGDLPGPNKRGLLDAIGPEAKIKWKERLNLWANKTFNRLEQREGFPHAVFDVSTNDEAIIELVLKTADWLEAAVRMATESQMGNRCTERHVVPNMNGATETALKLCSLFFNETIDPEEIPIQPSPGEKAFEYLAAKIRHAVMVDSLEGQSRGPWITREDETRLYREPCVDD